MVLATGPTVLLQPKASSMRLRIRWLTEYPGRISKSGKKAGTDSDL
jgi:hypothetical protein